VCIFRPVRILQERALLTVYPVLPEIWLETAIEDYKNRDDATLNIPLKFDGQPYSIDDLVEEQKRNIYPVLAKLREFMTCLRMVLFCPLFGTICGKAGAGKSTVLNTLTGTIRNLFQYNNTTITGGPTGTSAFNAFGETCHRILGQGINGEYYPNSLSLATRERLLKRCKHLLCLIIDERSLLSSKMLGTTAQIISEVIFDGGTAKEFFGGIPIVLLVGDDYQIPGQQEGALTALSRVGGSRMTQKGRQVFLRCAENVFQLQSIQRVSDSQREAKEMLDRVRIGENVLDKDVRKIQSLHLNAIREKHGDDYVKEIENEAVYLFWTNEKRAQRNLFRLGETNTDQNPTVIVKPISQGGKYGIGIASHFQDKLPPASMLCVNARVCIQGCNFYPTWGLHNGACGTVQEIIFEEGKDPNKGDHPKYVVVNFPQYIGPTWDADRPKVNCCTFRKL
jgi:energy-coupling factor transporter ATP-binding protein EcfA2